METLMSMETLARSSMAEIFKTESRNDIMTGPK
jgi:hypothetical protein